MHSSVNGLSAAELAAPLEVARGEFYVVCDLLQGIHAVKTSLGFPGPHGGKKRVLACVFGQNGDCAVTEGWW